MCGRITLTTSGEIVAQVFGLASAPRLSARYNIAPSQLLPIVRFAGEPPATHLDVARWGLVPGWAKDPAIGNRMINARAETVGEKPAYRAAFRSRRCLIVADGFYEWRQAAPRKQPYLVRGRDHRPFAIAGLWETWQAADGPPLLTCTVITTAANGFMAPIHDRMPVILEVSQHAAWLDPCANPRTLASLLVPCREDRLEAFAVSPHVNNPKHDDPACIEPLALAET